MVMTSQYITTTYQPIQFTLPLQYYSDEITGNIDSIYIYTRRSGIASGIASEGTEYYQIALIRTNVQKKIEGSISKFQHVIG